RKNDQKDEQQNKKKKREKAMTTNMNDFSLFIHPSLCIQLILQKKRKKKRTTNNKDFRLNNKYLNDDLVVTHILTRLPAKSLMRFNTRQAITPWIRSSVSLEKLPFKEPDHLKLVVDHYQLVVTCEVLTVGVDASWRIIDALPKCQFDDRDCTYANGSVYWRTSPYGSLLEFDMGSEKFRTIRIPKFIDRCKLIEQDGCLTMVPYHRLGRRIVTLWTFHDRNNKKCSNGTTSNTSEGEEWTAFTFEQPDRNYCWTNWNIILHPIPGKDRIILETYTPDQKFSKNVKIFMLQQDRQHFQRVLNQTDSSLPFGMFQNL
ncbi:hypothetical protein LINGRAHAP2_LOCUS28304, partial [Linum grandiflorum]